MSRDTKWEHLEPSWGRLAYSWGRKILLPISCLNTRIYIYMGFS